MGMHKGSDSTDSQARLQQRCWQVGACMAVATLLFLAFSLCPFVNSMQTCDTTDMVIVACAMIVIVVSEVIVLGALMSRGEVFKRVRPFAEVALVRQYANALSPPGCRNTSFSIPLRI
jgi:hypothetical protein